MSDFDKDFTDGATERVSEILNEVFESSSVDSVTVTGFAPGVSAPISLKFYAPDFQANFKLCNRLNGHPVWIRDGILEQGPMEYTTAFFKTFPTGSIFYSVFDVEAEREVFISFREVLDDVIKRRGGRPLSSSPRKRKRLYGERNKDGIPNPEHN
jgi:hypothetical protein